MMKSVFSAVTNKYLNVNVLRKFGLTNKAVHVTMSALRVLIRTKPDRRISH